MKVLGRKIRLHAHAAQKGEPFFLGVTMHREYCEGCGEPEDIMEVGVGLIVFAVTVHKH